MAVSCEPLFTMREAIVGKLEKANEAIEGFQHDLVAATMALAGAQASAALCFFAGAPPAIALCAAAVAIAIATCYAVVAYYEARLEEAVHAQGEAQAAQDEIDKAISHCESLESWQEEAAEGIINSAPSPDGLSEPPEQDSGPAEEAEAAVAELETSFGEDDGEGDYA